MITKRSERNNYILLLENDTMTDFFTMDDFDFAGKKVLLRVDINAPIDPSTGHILDDTRMRRILPTLAELEDSAVAILAHQSRPGKKDFTDMGKHAERLSHLTGREVEYIDDLFGSRAMSAIEGMEPGDIILLENTRFYSEEVSLKGKPADVQESTHIVSNLHPLFDYYINDAFAAAHRAQPTLIGFAKKIPSVAGRLMEKELVGLGKALHGKRPIIAVLGGAKFDDSIDIAANMLENNIADRVLTSGAVANLFILASGRRLGKPSEDFLNENGNSDALLKKAEELIEKYPEKLVLPHDLAVDYRGKREDIGLDELPLDYPILDIGFQTIASYVWEIRDAGTVILNGPAGVFEREEFALGTREIFMAVANSKGYGVIGGGHSTAMVSQLGIERKIDHISTGGGAAINFLAGRKMPAVEALRQSKEHFRKG